MWKYTTGCWTLRSTHKPSYMLEAAATTVCLSVADILRPDPSAYLLHANKPCMGCAARGPGGRKGGGEGGGLPPTPPHAGVEGSGIAQQYSFILFDNETAAH